MWGEYQVCVYLGCELNTETVGEVGLCSPGGDLVSGALLVICVLRVQIIYLVAGDVIVWDGAQEAARVECSASARGC